jgi:acyl-CoA synthetase (AMP-forming)/AMP-acid ligase II
MMIGTPYSSVVQERAANALLASGAPESAALVEGDALVTYAELAARVQRRREELDLAPRSLVVLRGANTVEFVTTYLALLAADHVPILAGSHADGLAAAWDADAVIGVDDDRVHVERRPAGASRVLHPDLALLLSTSGSTGAAKLVRLSHGNLVTNARAIAEYLTLARPDRGITSLPLHYCYGLSVLHSHLVAGAGIVMTTASVVDPCFAAAMRTGGVTNLAGVPHSFELLERVGPEVIRVPSLRFVTQAGGRLPPERVREWAERTRRWGVAFYVMYGQTEATARMAYLPPDLARDHPHAIGRPIPGGQLHLRPVDGAPNGVGELIYRGPNVMLGYATTQSDLALGATLDELPTGDLARYDTANDLFEIVGRRSRFVKPFGLRIDLDAVEAALTTSSVHAAVAGDDARVVVSAPGLAAPIVRQHVVALTGLPAATVHVDTAPTPRTASGKVDYGALIDRAGPLASTGAGGRRASSVAETYAKVLGGRPVGPTSTFVSLGGDSLNYVECSIQLETTLGRLPTDWHLRTVAELDATDRREALPRLDTTALLRSVGILAVVATHMKLWYFPGGSHLMLAVVGYNFSRFHLSIESNRARVVAVLRTIGRTALPAVTFVGIWMLVVGGYSLPTLTLVNNYLGPESHRNGRWHYWFIEALVQLLLVTVAILAIGPVRRLERRSPYLFALILLLATLTFRYHWAVIGGLTNLRFQTHGVAWFFVLGWLVHRSTTIGLKLATTALCLLTIPGFFHRPEREWFIALGIIVLIWARHVLMPRACAQAIAVVASASIAIFVTHFRIYPALDRHLPRSVAYLVTIAAGIAIWYVVAHVARSTRRVVTRHVAPWRPSTLLRPHRPYRMHTTDQQSPQPAGKSREIRFAPSANAGRSAT